MRRAWLLLALGVGCSGRDEKFAKLWSGLEAAIESPTKVEAYRIGVSEGAQPFQDYPALRVLSGPVDVGADDSKKLARLLLDSHSYYRGPAKGCLPTPGVKVAFHREKRDPVWVYFCFECLILIVYDGGTLRGADDFDPAAPAFAAVMKALFPKDAVIQALR